MKLKIVHALYCAFMPLFLMAQNDKNVFIKSHKPGTDTTIPVIALKPKAYVAISMGGALPFGNYRDSGFAKPGFNIALSGAIPVYKSFLGVAFKFDYGNNSIDQKKFLNTFISSPSNLTMQIVGVKYSITSLNPFFYKTMLLGFYYSFISDYKFYVDLKVLCGVLFANSPSANINADYFGSDIAFLQPAVLSYAFCYGAGAEIHYFTTRTFNLLAYFNFSASKLQFNIATTAVSQSTNWMIGNTFACEKETQLIAVANVGLGIACTPFKK